MAREPNLIESAVNVADVIHEYAKKRKWNPAGYRIEMSINKNLYILSVYLFLDFGISEDESQTIYDDVFDAIFEKYPDRVPGFNSFGMIVRGVGDPGLNWATRYDDEIQVDPNLLNTPTAVPAR